jgi:hypothetical protein
MIYEWTRMLAAALQTEILLPHRQKVVCCAAAGIFSDGLPIFAE